MSGAPTAASMRVLVIMPSWLGDVVMATPALRVIRDSLPGSLIGVLVRPGLDELLAGTSLVDQVHVDRARGVMGPKLVAAKLRPERYDTALLLTNSFSTALIARLAWIRRRIGYDRDGRGLLLTDRLKPPRRARPHRGFAPIPAVDYYLEAANVLLADSTAETPRSAPALELGVTEAQRSAGHALLASAGITSPDTNSPHRYAVLNPGANNPAKRWPAERFAEVATHLAQTHALRVLINGSPAERELAETIVDLAREKAPDLPPPIALPALGITIGSLKEVLRTAALLVTNDTGPRHLAAAFGVPTVALFGPTDPRWTTLPEGDPVAPGVPRERVLVADPTLPESEVADDHPDRCSIDRISLADVIDACDQRVVRCSAH